MPPSVAPPESTRQIDNNEAKAAAAANPNPQQNLNLTAPGLPHGLPNVDPLIANRYVLYYREGQNPHPQMAFFDLSGDFRQVISRVKRHCELMNKRFINVRPFLMNLDDEEKRIGRYEPLSTPKDT